MLASAPTSKLLEAGRLGRSRSSTGESFGDHNTSAPRSGPLLLERDVRLVHFGACARPARISGDERARTATLGVQIEGFFLVRCELGEHRALVELAVVAS